MAAKPATYQGSIGLQWTMCISSLVPARGTSTLPKVLVPLAGTRPPLLASAFAAGIWSLLFSRDGFGLGEQEQVISAACLGVGARHIEAAEGVDADKRTSGFAVEVEIADEVL